MSRGAGLRKKRIEKRKEKERGEAGKRFIGSCAVGFQNVVKRAFWQIVWTIFSHYLWSPFRQAWKRYKNCLENSHKEE